MPAKPNSSIVVATVLIMGNHQLKSCNSPPDPESRTSLLCKQGV
jgi:hypothetical protein